jgi:hypothetical protein
MKFSIGNTKLGKDTAILNITSATSCPSRSLGLCKLAHKCYAMKAERQYPACRPFRDRQSQDWDTQTPEEITEPIIKLKHKLKFVRISEAGDFKDQQDVEKLNRIALILNDHGIRVYGYTARKDLNFDNLHPNLVLNGTYFKIHNEFIPVPQIDNSMMQDPEAEICDGQCPTCDHCKERKGKKIYIKIH